MSENKSCRSSRIRYRKVLTEKAWEDAVQGLGFFDEETLKGTLSPQKVFLSVYFLTFFVFDNDDMKSHVTFLCNVFQKYESKSIPVT